MPVPVIRFGYLGVDVFFILSGFVLSYVYASKLSAPDFRSYRRFLQARIARIYPLHVITLCALGLIVLAAPAFAARYSMPDQRWGLGPFIASLFLIQNWAHWLPTCWNTPSWSLSAEFFAYLFFPLFLWATQRWRGHTLPLLLALGCLLLFLATIRADGIHRLNLTGTPGMLRMVFEIACGCLLYRAISNGLQVLPVVADIAAIGLLAAAFFIKGAEFLALPAFALVVLLAAQNHGPIARSLSITPIVFLGEISYSIYLVHWILLQLSNWFFGIRHINTIGGAIWGVAFIAVVLTVATLTFRLVEQPARRWGRSLSLAHAQAGSGVT